MGCSVSSAPTKFIYWGPNPQHIRMSQYLEISSLKRSLRVNWTEQNWRLKWCFPNSSAVTNPSAMQENQETWIQSLCWEDPLGKEMVTHSSILAWNIAWTEELGRLQSMGLQRVRYDWACAQGKMRSLEWIIIHYSQYSYKKGKYGHRCAKEDQSKQTHTVILWLLWRLVSRPPIDSKSMDDQVPYIKEHSICI